MRNLIVVLGVLGIAGFLFFKLFQSVIRFAGGTKSRIEKDRKELKSLSAGYDDALVPITNEELALLSSKVETELIDNRYFHTERGVLTSIYDEAIATYCYREYNSDSSILLASSKDVDFEFIEKEEEVEMRINGFLQGKIQNDGALIGEDGVLLAAIKNNHRSEYSTMSIREQKVAELLNSNKETMDSNSRVFLELKPLDQVGQNILLGMTIYNTLIKT